MEILKMEVKNMLRWNRNRKGFTLVELAIVIVILGILALYALPKYQGLVKEARSSEARAQVGSFRSALAIYYAKNGGVFPAYTYVNDGSIFANDTVPEVEIAAGNRKNAVVAGNGDGKVEKDDDVTDAGGWVYDVSNGSTGNPAPAANTAADVRINSKAEDPANSGHYWYEY